MAEGRPSPDYPPTSDPSVNAHEAYAGNASSTGAEASNATPRPNQTRPNQIRLTASELLRENVEARARPMPSRLGVTIGEHLDEFDNWTDSHGDGFDTLVYMYLHNERPPPGWSSNVRPGTTVPYNDDEAYRRKRPSLASRRTNRRGGANVVSSVSRSSWIERIIVESRTRRAAGRHSRSTAPPCNPSTAPQYSSTSVPQYNPIRTPSRPKYVTPTTLQCLSCHRASGHDGSCTS